MSTQATREGPFIVTVERWPKRSHRAFPTLEAAQYEVDEQIEALGGSIDEWPDVTIDGGTVGPLPDGHIEVSPGDYGVLILFGELSEHDTHTAEAICAAANARWEARP